MKERILNFSLEENPDQKTVDSIIELLKGKTIEESETILWSVEHAVKKSTKITYFSH